MSGSVAQLKEDVARCDSRTKWGYACTCGHHHADGQLSQAGRSILATDNTKKEK